MNRYFGRPTGWTDVNLSDYIYIDDYNCVEKVQVKYSPVHITSSAQTIKVHAPLSESRFDQIRETAQDIGMKVNAGKTQLLCISGRSDSIVTTHIKNEGQMIESGSSLKILGFYFGTKPGVEEHVANIEKKFRSRIWSLRFLKRARLSNTQLSKLYQGVLRPVIEYCCPTYHSMLTEGQSDRLEKLQKRALKTIYGWNNTYEKLLDISGIQRLEERRRELF